MELGGGGGGGYTFRACPDVLQAQGCRVLFSEGESQQLQGLIRRLDELGEVASQPQCVCCD